MECVGQNLECRLMASVVVCHNVLFLVLMSMLLLSSLSLSLPSDALA